MHRFLRETIAALIIAQLPPLYYRGLHFQILHKMLDLELSKS